jgi:hypothetical protein
MDLITDLPPLNGFDSILVIIDHGLTKGVILSPCKKTISSETISSEQTGNLIFQKLLTQFGCPNKIISDRDPRFMAESFQASLGLMGIKSSPLTVFHP